MKIRLIVLSAVLAAAILCSVPIAKVGAVTIAELQAQVNALLAQIAQLQAQQTTPAAWCHTFNINLRIGDGGPEIASIVTAFVREGLLMGAPGEAVRNNFDEEIASYVTAFQEKYASQILTPNGLTHGNGYVGPSTRRKLNALYGCVPTTACTDSDGGVVTDVFGSTYVKSGTFELTHPDECALVSNYDNNGNPVGWQSADFCSGNNCYIQEAFCRLDSQGNVIDADADKLIKCPNGCSNGACIQSTTPSITVTSPNGGETWQIGENHQITWTATGVNNVLIIIENDTNGKTCNLTPTTGTAASGGVWNYYPVVATPQCTQDILLGNKIKVFVRNADSSSVPGDMSDNYFTIAAPNALTLVSSSASPSANVGGNVQVKCNFGVQWLGCVQARHGDSNCTYKGYDGNDSLWDCAATTAGTVKNYCNTFAYSAESRVVCTDQTIQIPQSTNVVAPTASSSLDLKANNSDGPVTITAGAPLALSWTASGVSSCTSNWGGAVSSAGGTATLNSSVLGSTQTYTITCTNSAGGSAADSVTVNTATATPSITVTSPNGGETWKLGETHNVTWTSSGMGTGKVYIGLRSSTTNYSFAYDVPASSGSYSWTIDSAHVPTGTWKLVIGGYSSSIVYAEDTSGNYFTIVATATTSCTDSDSGRNYYTRGTMTTNSPQWAASPNNTDFCATSVTGGIQSVASCSGSGCFIKEYYCDGATPSQEIVVCPNGCSNGACNPSITVTSPNGGETWKVGETHNITWNSTGMTKVAINLKDYSGANHNYGIASGVTASLGSYSWTVPDNTFVGTGSQYKIEISEYATSTLYVSDFSNNYFTIAAAATTATTCTDTDSGRNYYTRGTMSTNSPQWAASPNNTDFCATSVTGGIQYVPSCTGSGCFIKEYYCDGVTPSQEIVVCPNGCSNGACAPSITVTSPNGSEQWTQGTTHNITWTSNGISNAYIYFTAFDASGTQANKESIVLPVSASSGSYSWAIPSTFVVGHANAARLKVLITSTPGGVGTGNVSDSSDNYFSIVASTTGISQQNQIASIYQALLNILAQLNATPQ